MNIDQYRQMVAEQAKPKDETTTAPVVVTPTEPIVQPTTSIKVDDKELTIDEIKELQKGYLRQSDYTKKTQQLAEQRGEVEKYQSIIQAISQDPELAEKAGLEFQDPEQSQMERLEGMLVELFVDKEMTSLETKYKDFNRDEVRAFAQEREMTNFEDAYKLMTVANAKPLNEQELREQIKAELLKELNANKPIPTSIITTNGGGAPTHTEQPTLSAVEYKIATSMGMTPQDYIKWRDI